MSAATGVHAAEDVVIAGSNPSLCGADGDWTAAKPAHAAEDTIVEYSNPSLCRGDDEMSAATGVHAAEDVVIAGSNPSLCGADGDWTVAKPVHAAEDAIVEHSNPSLTTTSGPAAESAIVGRSNPMRAELERGRVHDEWSAATRACVAGDAAIEHINPMRSCEATSDELRVDPLTGLLRTRVDFVELYGSDEEWNMGLLHVQAAVMQQRNPMRPEEETPSL